MGKPIVKDPRANAAAPKPAAAPAPVLKTGEKAPDTVHTPSAAAPGPDTAATPAAAPARPRKRIEEEKVSVTVHTAFNLTPDHGPMVRYHTGTQDMPASHAHHFYAKHHLDVNE